MKRVTYVWHKALVSIGGRYFWEGKKRKGEGLTVENLPPCTMYIF